MAGPLSTITLSVPWPWNGVTYGTDGAFGPVALANPTICRVPVSPLICTYWPTAYPSSIHDRPSSRLRLLAFASTLPVIDSSELPPPWITVRPPCGPATDTWRTTFVALASWLPRNCIVFPSAEMPATRHRATPSSRMTSWPTTNPSVVQLPIVRVSVPPDSLMSVAGLSAVPTTGTLTVTSISASVAVSVLSSEPLGGAGRG